MKQRVIDCLFYVFIVLITLTFVYLDRGHIWFQLTGGIVGLFVLFNLLLYNSKRR
jgi:hypothetical protein